VGGREKDFVDSVKPSSHAAMSGKNSALPNLMHDHRSAYMHGGGGACGRRGGEGWGGGVWAGGGLKTPCEFTEGWGG